MLVYIIFLSFIFLLIFMECTMRKLSNGVIGINHKYIEKNEKRQLSIFFKLSILILFCFTAFRFDIGWDYMAYYHTIENDMITNIVSTNEYLTIALIEISKKIGITNLYFFVNAFICIFFITKTIKNYSNDIWMSLIFFICFPLFYLNSLSVIRFFSALSITFYGFKFIERNNFKSYIITIIIASMFHKSASIAIIFYFIRNIKFKVYTQMIILLALPIISKIINTFIFNFLPRYSVYTQITLAQEGTKAIIIFIVLAVISMMLKNKIIVNDNIARIYYNIFFIGVCIYIMFLNQGTMGHRLSLFGTIYSLLLVPKMVSIFKFSKYSTILNILIYLFCILAISYTIYVGGQTYIPYRTIWNKY